MHLTQTIIIVLQINAAFGRRRKHSSSSEESIENIVYYKDCNRKKATSTTENLMMRQRLLMTTTRPEPLCPNPRMCCQMTCGNECSSDSNPDATRQLAERSMMSPMHPPSQPNPVQLFENRAKKKRVPLTPIEARRNLEFSKDHIKSLIAQDSDIKKILKDLVRVTMQKVDLEEIIENGGKKDVKNKEPSDNVNDYME